MTTPEPDRLTRLAESAAELASDYADLAGASGEQFVFLARRARSNRRMIRALVVSVVLDVVLSAILGWVVVQVRHNEDSNAANQAATSALAHRLDVAQTTTRQKTFCPLYTLLLAGDTPAARAAAKDKAAFDHTVMVIQQGYDALGCAAFATDAPKAG